MQSFNGYGQVSGQGGNGRDKKRFTIIGVSSLILVAMVVAVAVGVSHNRHNGSGDTPEADNSGEINTSMKAITQICQPTDFKDACVKSLTAAAGNDTTDPKDLIKLSFKVAIDHMREVFNHSAVLQEAAKDPRTSQALENCQELVDYAIDDLNNSIDKMDKFDLSQVQELVADFKTWLSASVTYQETCLDGFENTTGDTGESMRKAMKTSSELTRNTLAIVSEISSLLTTFKIPLFTRRLLSTSENDGHPSWVSARHRRLLAAETIVPNATVAKDGSGDFKTINEAVATIPLKSNDTFIIHVKEGIYNEQVWIEKGKNNVMMYGDGPTKTKITGSQNFIDGVPTFKTATFAVVGNGFIAKDMGFENSAGAEKHQAVAIRVQSDMSVFYNCQMDGYQDTLYAHTHRQFYRDCTISGTIDFIFGDSAVVFQNCKMIVRKPMINQQNIVTAQGRKDVRQTTGIVLQNCVITGEVDYIPVKDKFPSYLGRPWKEFSRTIIMQSDIGDVIQPVGWLPWMGDFALSTAYYSEYQNRGLGSATAKRVTWPAIKTIDPEIAATFTVRNFIQGDIWLNATGVPFELDMMTL